MSKPDVKAINACLPQTQCGECGYPGCQPYAEAIAEGGAQIDACPPGGIETLHALSNLLEIDPKPFEASVKDNTRPPKLALIREAECIGCTKCLPACPVDAIIGASKMLHQIISDECTGCGLCIEPCPVDCIELVDIPTTGYDRDIAKARHDAKKIRELKKAQQKERVYRAKRHLKDRTQDKAAKQAYIMDALKRAHKK